MEEARNMSRKNNVKAEVDQMNKLGYFRIDSEIDKIFYGREPGNIT